MSGAEIPSFWPKRLQGYREKLLELAVLGLVTALVSRLYGRWAEQAISQPWQALWFLLPLGAAGVIVCRFLAGRSNLRLRGPFLLFLAIYVCFFTVAATADFLDWSRELTVFSRPAPRNWLTPVSLGDWRYRLVRKQPLVPDDIVVVTVEPLGARRPEDGRLEMVRLIKMASAAKAVAFDFYLEGELEIDPLLCQVIEQSEVPVFIGYRFSRLRGSIVREPLPRSVQACLEEERLGHLAGFRDVDRVVRFVPLYFGNDPSRPSLSLRAARVVGADVAVPQDGLLRFVEPARPVPVVPYKELFEDARARAILTDRLVVVGEDSPGEWFETPFGPKLGAVIHAETVHSLRSAHFIRNNPWWLGFLTTLLFCYLLTGYAARGAGAKKLLAFCAAASGLVVAVSALAARFGPEWFDVVYPLSATWLLLGLLLAFRRARVRPRSRGSVA